MRSTTTATAARGPGALKLPQRVQVEPGRQTFLVHFEVKMKSLAMMVLNKNASLDPHLVVRASECMHCQSLACVFVCIV